MRGGAYFDPDPRYYRDTFMADYRSRDPEFAGQGHPEDGASPPPMRGG